MSRSMCSKIYISRKKLKWLIYIFKKSPGGGGRVHCIIKPKRLIISSSSSDPFERASALLACSANSWDARARARAIIATIGFHPLLFTAPARRRPAGPRTDGRTDRTPAATDGDRDGSRERGRRQGPSTMPWPRLRMD